MNRYLKINDPRTSNLQWMVRLVADGDTYIDTRSGAPVKEVCDRTRSYSLEISVRVETELSRFDFSVVGAASLSEIMSDGELPLMIYEGVPVSISPEMRGWMQSWAKDGFTFGGSPSNPAIVDTKVIAVIDSGSFRRIEKTVFTSESEGAVELLMKAIRSAQKECSPHEGQCQMVTFTKAEADKATDDELRFHIMDVCQGD
jgi:hypothetical protein